MNKEQIISQLKYPLLTGATLEQNYQSILKFHRLPFFVKSLYVEAGVTKRQIENFKEVTNLMWSQLAELLMMTERSLHKKKGTELFNKKYADKFIAFVEFYSHLYNLYGNRLTVNVLLSSNIKQEDGFIMPLDLMPYHAGRTYLIETVFHHSKTASV